MNIGNAGMTGARGRTLTLSAMTAAGTVRPENGLVGPQYYMKITLMSFPHNFASIIFSIRYIYLEDEVQTISNDFDLRNIFVVR